MGTDNMVLITFGFVDRLRFAINRYLVMLEDSEENLCGSCYELTEGRLRGFVAWCAREEVQEMSGIVT